MATADDSAETVAVRIRQEHDHLFKVLADLEVWLRSTTTPDEWVSSVTRRLAELGEGLAPHFRFERESSLYTEVPERAPHLATRLERLMGEHQTFLTELGAIIAAARSALDPDEGLTGQLTVRITAFVSSLRRHECEENEVLTTAFQDDLGVGD